jgi:hypothetical protein
MFFTTYAFFAVTRESDLSPAIRIHTPIPKAGNPNMDRRRRAPQLALSHPSRIADLLQLDRTYIKAYKIADMMPIAPIAIRPEPAAILFLSTFRFTDRLF